MSPRFAFDVTRTATELRLLGDGEGAIPVDLWAVRAPDSLLRGVDLVRSLEGIDKAVVVDDVVLIEHEVVAGLSGREAALLGFPPPTEAIARLQSTGVVTRPDYKVTLSWVRPTGQAVAGAERTGAWLRVAGSWHRLPEPLFGIAEAIDNLAEVPANDVGGRMRALARLRDALPPADAGAPVMVEGALGTMTIAVAGAFSLDLEGEGLNARLVPILHREGAEGDTPLLSEEEQRAFADTRFYAFGEVRSVYLVAPGHYVALSPHLQKALGVVRRAHAAPVQTKRRLMQSPRAFLREALGDEADGVVLERVFRETPRYADRVIGLGLWQPRVLPWITIAATDWFGPEDGAPAPAGGLVVGDQRIELTPDQAQELATRIEEAIARGAPTAPLHAGAEEVAVPATIETLAKLRDLAEARRARAQPQEAPLPPTVLLIAPNEEQVEITGEFRRRGELPRGLPRALRTPLKRHQQEGLDWLQRSYLAGRPGVLLADDMGLGKTLQGLAFLCWLREAMTAGLVPRAPLLIVAPTGLLETWRAEHDRHLDAPGLGRCQLAFGRDLAAIRGRDGDGRPSLDRGALLDADWVLTTFETLRDYDRDFGAVEFSVMLMDEAQKIKTPGIRLTDAAKAMNAEFRIAMTGTPVENRLADLWCIVDAVHPACLDDLKTFSAKYERSGDPRALRELKARLDRPRGATPPLLKRRLLHDRLPDLPELREAIRSAPMPDGQASIYQMTVEGARGARRRGAVLEALQRLRAISLHPGPADAVDDTTFIAASARIQLAFAALDEIAAAGECALVFCDDIAMQARLAGVIQRRYNLLLAPMLINGTVAGAVRQARVDRFQGTPDGVFDCMILSPRAGGVGLTLTRANHVLHLSRWWNPAVEDQCNARARRIGQTRPVTVHLLLALRPDGHKSFDENLHALLARKRDLMHEALVPPLADESEQASLLAETLDA